MTNENFLENIPRRNENIGWKTDDNGKVTLEKENKGITNRIFQILFKKPRISYIHLDEMGSFVWPIIDGESNIIEIGKAVSEHFGDKAEPLYERLAQYFQVLHSYGFVLWDKK